MTTEQEIAELWARGDQQAAQQIVAPVANAHGRGYIESYDADSGKAAVRKGTPDTPATPGFDVPRWLQLAAGDYVEYRELGSDRVILAPIDRNARVNQFADPLTTAGQIVIGGANGQPAALDPPADPSVRSSLRWAGDVGPVWDDVSVDPPPPTALTLAVAALVGDTNLKYTGATTGLVVGDWLRVGGGNEIVQSSVLGTSGAGGTGITFAPAFLAAHSVGASVVKTSPPPPAPPPVASSNFPRMTMWWPYWAGADTTKVSDVADDMVYMHQGGVVLMGMQWGSAYALPGDVSAKLDIFIAKGLKPYLGLWVGHLDTPDRNAGLAAWNAGAGKWAGIVLDAENQWVQHCKTVANGGVGAVQAKADFDGFMAIFRPLTDQLAVACYSSPTSFPNYNYDWWNEAVDTFLPLAYFNSSTDTAQNILDTMYRKFAQAATGWASASKPIIPVVNGYSATLTAAQVTERQTYINDSRSTAAQVWRWIETFPSNMREMLHGI